MKLKRNDLCNEQLLWGALGLPATGQPSTANLNEHSDVIFICIDFENGRQIKSHARSGLLAMSNKKRAQAGVSIFDTRTLSSPSPQQALRTYNIGLGGSPSSKKHVDRRFLFGQTTWICQLADLLGSIEKLLDRTRNIVLVGHNLPSDLYVLQALGFDSETSIVGVLDTESIALRAFGPPDIRGGLRLKGVLDKLQCPVEGFHIGGNDANFTLRALLLLAVEGYSNSADSLDDHVVGRLEKIKAICHSPLLRLPPPSPSRTRRRVRRRVSG